jgi:hypothetical protein
MSSPGPHRSASTMEEQAPHESPLADTPVFSGGEDVGSTFVASPVSGLPSPGISVEFHGDPESRRPLDSVLYVLGSLFV